MKIIGKKVENELKIKSNLYILVKKNYNNYVINS